MKLSEIRYLAEQAIDRDALNHHAEATLKICEEYQKLYLVLEEIQSAKGYSAGKMREIARDAMNKAEDQIWPDMELE